MANILIVDDTKNIRKMVALTLSQAGHRTDDAADGAQGLALFGEGAAWDLTLVDQQMPQVSGEEFVVEARRRDPMARIVMMTAFATPQLAAQVIQSGALDFLRKPFTTDVLRGAVEVALSQPRQIAPLSAFDPNPTLAQPGQQGYTMPRISWRMNGFSFWPLGAPQTGAHPTGFALGRLFQVNAPDGTHSSCFAGVTPHVREQIERGRAIQDDDPFWDKVCGQTLLQFLAQHAQTPPDVLPVYEVPTSRESKSGLVTWGAFFEK